MTNKAGISKPLSMMTYEDLLISSKFFYSEGSENSQVLFPDETKSLELSEAGCQQDGPAKSNAAEFCSQYHENSDNQSLFDIDIAMEAACGDPTFLVT